MSPDSACAMIIAHNAKVDSVGFAMMLSNTLNEQRTATYMGVLLGILMLVVGLFLGWLLGTRSKSRA